MKAGQGAKIGPVAGTFLVATTMIGSGIYMLPAAAASIGSITILGWLLAALGATLTGLTLAALARAGTGGTYLDSIARAFGPFAGILAAILYILSVLISLPMVAVAAAGYTGFLFPALAAQREALLLAVGYIWLFVVVAAASAPLVARFGSLALFVGLVPLVLVATLGWTHFDPDIFRASWNMTGRPDSSAMLSAALLLFMAYLGLENASILSDLMENPGRNVPIATIAGILFTTLIYIASTTVVSGLIPAAELARSAAPFADAAAIFLGATAALLVAVCGAVKASGTLGALQLGTVESILILKRQTTGTGLSRTTTGVVVGVLATALAIATSSPSAAAQFAVLATAMVTIGIVTYLMAAAALVKTRTGLPRLAGIACFLLLFGFVVAQPPADLRNAAVLSGAAVVVAALLLVWRRRRNIHPV